MTVKILTNLIFLTLLEITDPEMTVEVEGFFKSGPKSYILNKIEDTKSMLFPVIGIGQINYITYMYKY